VCASKGYNADSQADELRYIQGNLHHKLRGSVHMQSNLSYEIYTLLQASQKSHHVALLQHLQLERRHVLRNDVIDPLLV